MTSHRTFRLLINLDYVESSFLKLDSDKKKITRNRSNYLGWSVDDSEKGTSNREDADFLKLVFSESLQFLMIFKIFFRIFNSKLAEKKIIENVDFELPQKRFSTMTSLLPLYIDIVRIVNDVTSTIFNVTWLADAIGPTTKRFLSTQKWKKNVVYCGWFMFKILNFSAVVSK